MIKKSGSNYVLMSKDGKKHLGTFKTREEAIKQEIHINYWKHKKATGK